MRPLRGPADGLTASLYIYINKTRRRWQDATANERSTNAGRMPRNLLLQLPRRFLTAAKAGSAAWTPRKKKRGGGRMPARPARRKDTARLGYHDSGAGPSGAGRQGRPSGRGVKRPDAGAVAAAAASPRPPAGRQDAARKLCEAGRRAPLSLTVGTRDLSCKRASSAGSSLRGMARGARATRGNAASIPPRFEASRAGSRDRRTPLPPVGCTCASVRSEIV